MRLHVRLRARLRASVAALMVTVGAPFVAACDKATEVVEPAAGDARTPDPAATESAIPGSIIKPGGAASTPPPAHGKTTVSLVPALAEGAAPPLDTWMRDTAGPALLSGDLQAIAASFDLIRAAAPPTSTYANWASIAKDGADAARSGHLDAVKAACRVCHEEYERSYHADLAMRPLPLSFPAPSVSPPPPPPTGSR